jgi:K+-transporting ATPase ATPase A chain
MTLAGWLQDILLFAVVLACVKPLGSFMAKIFSGERVWCTARGPDRIGDL